MLETITHDDVEAILRRLRDPLPCPPLSDSSPCPSPFPPLFPCWCGEHHINSYAQSKIEINPKLEIKTIRRVPDSPLSPLLLHPPSPPLRPPPLSRPRLSQRSHVKSTSTFVLNSPRRHRTSLRAHASPKTGLVQASTNRREDDSGGKYER
ncbi:hypothetical protein C8R45DRAFT_1000797 [Mycena sanguinolenta]|nr:hypothetical protein C8R45DRAFT_1000797 [Mycena sanguinolenta]